MVSIVSCSDEHIYKHVSFATPLEREASNPTNYVVAHSCVGVTSVAYRHDVTNARIYDVLAVPERRVV